MQLKKYLYLLLLLPFTLKPFSAKAQQSKVKVKKLRYDETSPGITVDEEAVDVLLELDNQDQINFMYLHDAITGASPTGVETPTTTTVDTTTSASTKNSTTTHGGGQDYAEFHDERHAFTLGYRYVHTSDLSFKGELTYSIENDYKSNGVGLSTDILFNQKNTTLNFSVNRNEDKITHKSGNTEKVDDKTVSTYSTAVSQLFTPSQFAGIGISYGESLGYHTDNYKKVKVGTAVVAENRPESRYFFSYNGEYKLQFAENHSIRIMLNKYQDSWKINSYSLNLETVHQVTDSFLLSFFARYYNQSAAYFRKREFSEGDTSRYRSSDLRLSSFSANNYSVTVYYLFTENLTLEGSYGIYKQYSGSPSLLAQNGASTGSITRYDKDGDEEENDENYGGGAGKAKSAITEATIISAALEYRF